MSGRTDQSSPLLIRAPPGSGATPPDRPVAPLFPAIGKKRPRLHARRRGTHAKTCFIQAVAKPPETLRSHGRRRALCAMTSDPAIQGTLHELFPLLKKNSAPPRRRVPVAANSARSSRDHRAPPLSRPEISRDRRDALRLRQNPEDRASPAQKARRPRPSRPDAGTKTT